jgi:hypothetical protein
MTWMTWVTPRLAILVPTFSKLQACFKTPPTTKDPDTRKPGLLLTASGVSQSRPCSHGAKDSFSPWRNFRSPRCRLLGREASWLLCFDISSGVVLLFGIYHIIRAVQGTGSLTCARGVQQVRKYAPSALRLAHASEPHLVHGWPRRVGTPFSLLYKVGSCPRSMFSSSNWLSCRHAMA